MVLYKPFVVDLHCKVYVTGAAREVPQVDGSLCRQTLFITGDGPSSLADWLTANAMTHHWGAVPCSHSRLQNPRLALRKFGAGDRDRTGDIQLGKLTFCH
jgi:hypothetical protein